MNLRARVDAFAHRFRKEVRVGNRSWRYYRLGVGDPILWLTGGLRRAALGFAFMERLAIRHTVIAPDYPPVQSIDAFIHAFDAILQAEGIGRLALGGQSYGGFLAQAYLARRGDVVDRLILSSTGPANYGKAWLPVEYLLIALARFLPEATVKNLLARGLLKAITVPVAERAEWMEIVNDLIQNDLSRADVVSHFAVAADSIRKNVVARDAYRSWRGRILVLTAKNDPTQSEKDIPRYESLFGRPVEVVTMADMGHTAALFNPEGYADLLERALE